MKKMLSFLIACLMMFSQSSLLKWPLFTKSILLTSSLFN